MENNTCTNENNDISASLLPLRVYSTTARHLGGNPAAGVGEIGYQFNRQL